MVANITVAILVVIALGAGIFGWWLTSHSAEDEHSSTDEDKSV